MPKTILVVDDHDGVRLLVARVLNAAGYAVTAVGSIREALGQAGHYDLMILDRLLPNGDGRKLWDVFPMVPAFVMSAEAPCDLLKPFTPGALLEHVERLIGGSV